MLFRLKFTPKFHEFLIILTGNLQTKLGPRLWPTTQYCALQELIKDKDLSIQKCLDVGEFGSVYKILDCQDLKTYALKVIPIGKYAKNASDIAKIKKIYRESEVMRKLGSSEQNAKQHVVTLRDVWFEGDFKNEFQRIVSSNDILKELYLPYQPIHSTTMVLKMDYYKTDLDTWMIQNREPTLGVVEIIIGQLFKGLSFIHSEQICHRDLRPTNIFVNYANGVIELKIGDFATAREITDAETFLTRCQVSTDFQSPELKSGMKFENKSEYYKTDVYSLGLIYLVLISEWKQKSEYQILIEQSNGSYAGVFDKIKAVFPNKFCFLQKMLTKDVAKRPSSVDGVDYFANLLL